MALDNFIPKLWSAQLFVSLRKALVFANLVNRDYEGEVSQLGDTIYINELGPVTVNTYSKGDTLTYETLDSAGKSLVISQGSSFSFKIDDIDKAQTSPKLMAGAMSEAAYRIADTVDGYLAGMYSQSGAGIGGSASSYIGSSSSSITVSSGNVIEVISYAQRYLLEENVQAGTPLFAVIPPWLHQKLLLAEVGGVGAEAVPKISGDGMIMNGFVGQALGFSLLISNNITSSSTQYRPMFFTRNAIAYAGQVAEVETIRLQTTFANAVRGLYLYGAKVVDPNQLVTGYLVAGAN